MLRRALAIALAAIAIVYLAAVGWLMANETRLVFRAGRPLGEARPSRPYQQVELRRADGGPQIAWAMTRPDARTWVLFLHGNDSTIASRFNIAHYEQLRQLGVNVFAPEYRGFAGLPGEPSEAALAEDARSAYEYLRRHEAVGADRLVIYGWSLGSGVAVDLASEVGQAGLILEGAPASIAAIGQQQYPIFPVRLIMRNPFDSVLKIGRVAAPILFLHSRDDQIVPIAEGRRLQAAARAPSLFVEVRGGHVAASEGDADNFYGAIRAFLRTYGLLPPDVPVSPGSQLGVLTSQK